MEFSFSTLGFFLSCLISKGWFRCCGMRLFCRGCVRGGASGTWSKYWLGRNIQFAAESCGRGFVSQTSASMRPISGPRGGWSPGSPHAPLPRPQVATPRRQGGAAAKHQSPSPSQNPASPFTHSPAHPVFSAAGRDFATTASSPANPNRSTTCSPPASVLNRELASFPLLPLVTASHRIALRTRILGFAHRCKPRLARSSSSPSNPVLSPL